MWSGNHFLMHHDFLLSCLPASVAVYTFKNLHRCIKHRYLISSPGGNPVERRIIAEEAGAWEGHVTRPSPTARDCRDKDSEPHRHGHRQRRERPACGARARPSPVVSVSYRSPRRGPVTSALNTGRRGSGRRPQGAPWCLSEQSRGRASGFYLCVTRSCACTSIASLFQKGLGVEGGRAEGLNCLPVRAEPRYPSPGGRNRLYPFMDFSPHRKSEWIFPDSVLCPSQNTC